jgi:hypothetical protein
MFENEVNSMQTPFPRSGSSFEFSYPTRWMYLEPQPAASTCESLGFDTAVIETPVTLYGFCVVVVVET